MSILLSCFVGSSMDAQKCCDTITYHQCFKYPPRGGQDTMEADNDQFTITETYHGNAKFYCQPKMDRLRELQLLGKLPSKPNSFGWLHQTDDLVRMHDQGNLSAFWGAQWRQWIENHHFPCNRQHGQPSCLKEDDGEYESLGPKFVFKIKSMLQKGNWSKLNRIRGKSPSIMVLTFDQKRALSTGDHILKVQFGYTRYNTMASINYKEEIVSPSKLFANWIPLKYPLSKRIQRKSQARPLLNSKKETIPLGWGLEINLRTKDEPCSIFIRGNMSPRRKGSLYQRFERNIWMYLLRRIQKCPASAGGLHVQWSIEADKPPVKQGATRMHPHLAFKYKLKSSFWVMEGF